MPIRSITIKPVLNGFVCQVGCQEIICTTPEHLGKEITRYYKNPITIEKEYLKKSVNKLIDIDSPAAPASINVDAYRAAQEESLFRR